MTGCDIIIFDESVLPDPEVRAMLSAFYSRSAKSIQERVSELSDKDIPTIKESLKKYSVQYGHASIRDMSSTTPIFLEKISLLATKCFESSQQGNYQESSTRYIPFNESGYYDPIDSPRSRFIMDSWIDFYYEMQTAIMLWLFQRFPKTPEQKEEVYEKAIRVKSFDICRSLLPCGIKTQFAMSMTFKALQEHLWMMNQHPVTEVKETSKRLSELLKTKYPNSFADANIGMKRYYSDVVKKDSYFTKFVVKDVLYPSLTEGFLPFDPVLVNRPKGVMIPTSYNRYGNFEFNFVMDYGSWRDLQRHRYTLSNRSSVVGYNGIRFSPDYFNLPGLPSSIRDKLDRFIESQANELYIMSVQEGADYSSFDFQYFYPLGTCVNCELIVTLPQLMYIFELRSSKSVHYTLRKKINSLWNMTERYLPIDMARYIDTSESEFYYERGNQDIVKTE